MEGTGQGMGGQCSPAALDRGGKLKANDLIYVTISLFCSTACACLIYASSDTDFYHPPEFREEEGEGGRQGEGGGMNRRNFAT